MGGVVSKKDHKNEIQRVKNETEEKRKKEVKEMKEKFEAERKQAVREKEKQLKAEQKRMEEKEKREREGQPLKTPWRRTQFEFGEEYCKKLTKEIKEFQIKLMEIKQGGQRNQRSAIERTKKNIVANILLLGPVGVGKSTFINSVLSISLGRLAHKAYTAGSSYGQVTSKLFTFFGDDEIDNVRLLDTNGLMEQKGLGFNVEDLIFLIDGRIKDGYKFKPSEPIDIKDPYYRHERTIDDMVHCAVFVIDAAKLSTYTDQYKEKIKKLQEKLVKEGVPRVVILTKCDELCPVVRDDISNIFRSKRTEDAVKMAAVTFAIPQSYIHPIVNYGEGEIDVDSFTNIPILLAVRQMVHFAGDYLEIQAQKEAMNEVQKVVN